MEFALTNQSIGMVYKSQGNHVKALEYLEISLKIKSHLKGKNSMDVADLLKNIGAIYCNQ